jgi:hypothetical protein
MMWCRTKIHPDEPSPFDKSEGETLSSTRPLADSITNQILDNLKAFWREGTPTEMRTNILISQVVALAAASKLFLAMWGNGNKAAALEYLASQVADRDLAEAAVEDSGTEEV